uniref:Xylose isomerase-like TIM barrel domain-containing protein n=1 Tax=Sinocyclocheilus anshuiensis TaxID=1608454 RepID=A0A671LME3_9TELE
TIRWQQQRRKNGTEKEDKVKEKINKRGIWNVVKSSMAIRGHAFALFLGSQRSWMRPALDTAAAVKFQEACAQHVFDPIHILPRGSYLMNCGSPKEDVFSKSQAMLVDELKTLQCTGKCAIVLMLSGKFSWFSELGSIIDRVRDKTRVGVCLDTCHAFAAGMVLRHFTAWRTYCFFTAFREIVNEPRLDNIPLILDTPGFEFAEQIELLYSICEKRRRIKQLLDGSYY